MTVGNSSSTRRVCLHWKGWVRSNPPTTSKRRHDIIKFQTCINMSYFDCLHLFVCLVFFFSTFELRLIALDESGCLVVSVHTKAVTHPPPRRAHSKSCQSNWQVPVSSFLPWKVEHGKHFVSSIHQARCSIKQRTHRLKWPNSATAHLKGDKWSVQFHQLLLKNLSLPYNSLPNLPQIFSWQ